MRKNALQFLAIIIACGWMLASCTDNDELNEAPSLSEIRSITLSETLASDGGNVERTDVFNYTDNRLTSHTTIQEMDHGQSITYEKNFTYTDKEAICTDSYGNTATYTLDAEGKATQCTSIEAGLTRNYQFHYDSNGFLTQIEETLNGQRHFLLTLTYNNENIQSIEADEVTLHYTTGNDANSYQLPDPMWENISPLSFHIDAIYARLLGKQSAHLPTLVTPEGNEQENTSYTYTWNENRLLSEINIGTTYTETVTDIYGNASEVSSTIWRYINIYIE